MSGNANLVDGLSAIGIGGYVLDVVYMGNVKELGTLLKSESGYIDFVIALFILGAIQKYGPAGKISMALTGITLVGLAIKVGEKTDITSITKKFASGEASIFQTVKSIVGAS